MGMEDVISAAPGPLAGQVRRVMSRRLLGRDLVLWVAGAGALFALSLAQSFTSSVNSDSASIGLQGWDMWHGNLLMHGWYAADASFYTLETPLYGAVETVMGLGATTLHVVSALIFTLVAAVAALVAISGQRGAAAYTRLGLVVALLAVPLCAGELAGLLLEKPNHYGTSIFLLLAFLIYARGVGRRSAAWGLLALLTAGQIGDATVQYVGVTTIVAVTLARIAFARRLLIPEVWLGVAAAASVPASIAIRHLMRHAGAYSMIKPAARIAPAATWLNHIGSTGEGLLRLFHIQLTAPSHITAGWVADQIFGGAAILAGVYALWRAARHWRSADAIDQLLFTGILVYPATYAFSTMVTPNGLGAYEFVGIIPMVAVLTARNLPIPSPSRQRAVAWAGGLTAMGLLLSGVFNPSAVTRPERLAAWLKTHDLHYGLAGYWDASSTTVDSGGSVNVRSVINIGNRYAIYAWVTNGSWYDAKRYDAHFVIADDTIPGITVADVKQIYGKPDAVYPVEGREIVVYDHVNLLKEVFHTPHPDY
jgi:hypothetical protein